MKGYEQRGLEYASGEIGNPLNEIVCSGSNAVFARGGQGGSVGLDIASNLRRPYLPPVSKATDHPSAVSFASAPSFTKCSSHIHTGSPVSTC